MQKPSHRNDIIDPKANDLVVCTFSLNCFLQLGMRFLEAEILGR